jgi:hypothetical protein
MLATKIKTIMYKKNVELNLAPLKLAVAVGASQGFMNFEMFSLLGSGPRAYRVICCVAPTTIVWPQLLCSDINCRKGCFRRVCRC